MSACTPACAHTYVYTQTCMSTHTSVCSACTPVCPHTHLYVYTHLYVCMHTCLCTHTYVYTHTCMSTHTSVCLYTSVCSARTPVCLHTCLYHLYLHPRLRVYTPTSVSPTSISTSVSTQPSALLLDFHNHWGSLAFHLQWCPESPR